MEGEGQVDDQKTTTFVTRRDNVATERLLKPPSFPEYSEISPLSRSYSAFYAYSGVMNYGGQGEEVVHQVASVRPSSKIASQRFEKSQ